MRGVLFIALLLSNILILAQETAEVRGYVYSDEGVPLKDVNIIQVGTKNKTVSQSNGYFSLKVTPSKKVTINISFLQRRRLFDIKIKEGEVKNLGEIKMGAIYLDTATVVGKNNDVEDKRPKEFLDKRPKIDFNLTSLPNASVEKTLTYITAAVSNNELTANYNVRGGNFDENLIYVNDIEIYRPF